MSTRVGYSGGTTQSPSYTDIADHCESIRVAFNSSIISYDTLVDRFFEFHNPFKTRLRRQYASMIFPHNCNQHDTATHLKLAFEKQKRCKCTTEIQMWPIDSFTNAEDYHQKYLLRQNKQILEFLADRFRLQSNSSEFVSSLLTTKLNGYFVGSMSVEDLRCDLNLLNLSDADQSALLELLE